MKPSLSFVRGTAIGSVLSLSVLAVIPVFAANANKEARGSHFTPEHHEEIIEALDNGDYETWKSLMENSAHSPKVMDVVTEDNFQTFIGIHALRKEGNFEGAKILAEESGIDFGRGKDMKDCGKRRGKKHGGHGRDFLDNLSEEGRVSFKEAMRSCRENNDDWETVKQCHHDLMEEHMNK